jgi:pyruvate-formate lyase-activating enzyme
MNDLEFKKQILDTKSSSFCAAKWYNATIWLGSGMSTSCHHPPAHKVDEHVIKFNPKALHNTPEKKNDRKQMLGGERPLGCEYCWKIEDMGRDAISDRVYKSKIYTTEELNEAFKIQWEEDVNLKTLEIAFDRTCQFACSYCNPAFSTSWVKDIRNDGPYTNLISDGRNHYTHRHDSAQLYNGDDANPYVEAFFKWWETDLHHTLQELRITGGEPLMSGHTWRLIDWFNEHRDQSKTRLAINSNLGFDRSLLERLVDSTQGIEVDVYTSNESMGSNAEYIRDGLDWNQWVENVHYLLGNDGIRRLHIMCTINALCLESLADFIAFMAKLKLQYGKESLAFTLNILRFPSFQSPLVLNDELRTQFRERLEQIILRYDHILEEHEINHIRRLCDYLDVVKTPHSDAFELPKLHNDFKMFYEQYDNRRGKNFAETFPQLREWYESLRI